MKQHASLRLLHWVAGLPEDFRFGLRIFHVYCVTAGSVLLVAAVFNHLAGLHPVTTLVGAIVGPIYLLFFYLSRFRGFGRLLLWPFTISGLALLAVLWFFSGGLQGSTPLVCVLGLIITLLVLENTSPWIVATVFCAFVGSLVGVEYLWPEFVIPYPSLEAQVADLRFGFLVTCGIVSLLIALLRKTYESGQAKVAEQNQQLRSQAVDLVESRNAAERAFKARSEFLSVVSHELRTPLNSVVGLTELLRDENPRPDQTRYLEILSFSASNLLGLVNDVLDYARLEAGHLELESSPLNLHELLDSVGAAFLHRAKEKGVEFRLQSDPEVPQLVKGDANRLIQILNNLLGNAIKFTNEGSVNLRVSAINAQIQFKVRDTGIGIPSDRIGHIFEKFTQADARISREFGGTGLGLSITQRLVELYGGSITVQSTLDVGTEFTVTLPLQAYVAVQDPQEKQGARLRPGLRVLLAEDYEPNVLLAKRLLEKWQAHVTVAANGVEALARCSEQHFDLLLLDVHMPEMDGIQAIRAVRDLGGFWATVPAFALSAAALPEERMAALSAGFSEYISKPFSPPQLHDRIATYCS